MIKYYKQDSYEKMEKWSEDFKTISAVLSDPINKSNQINAMSSSPTQKDTSTPPDPSTLVPANRRDPPLEWGHSTKLVACGSSNMISAHQNSMSSSSRQNSKETLIWISRTYMTTSRCASMCWLDFKKTSFLVTSPSKDTLSLKNTSSQIAITLPIPEIFRYTLPLDTHS